VGLLPQHRRLVDASAISDDVAAERGSWSATKPAELDRWFGPTQRRLVPALVIPVHSVRGDVELVALRPDEPRVVKDRRRKYELPAHCQMVVDVPPRVRPVLGDPTLPLLITEGARKADAAVTAGLYAIDIWGVWTWRGKNEHGGLTALDCWERIAFNDRMVCLAFDSDVMQKREVHQALERFAAFLRGRHADLRYVYLPSGNGGAKTGLDDFLATGHTRDDVLAHTTDELRPLPGDGHRSRGKPSTPAPRTGDLLLAIERFIRRFVILPSDAGYLTAALFALHTWAFNAAHATPYLVVESPEKQSGKSRLLEVLELLCWNALKVASITAAALFQSVSGHHPTLLIDEADAIFAGNSERNEDLRAVMNAGNVPGSKVMRGGKDGVPVSYDVYCPKVIAEIATGKLPDTIRDRSIIQPIDRKLRSERVERLRRHKLEAEVETLREQLAAWADEHRDELYAYDLPAPLEKISDRLEEAWEPLLAIADLAGGEFPAKARAAAEDLAGEGDDDVLASHVLLIALKDIFAKEEKLAVAALNSNDELPFGSWNDDKGIRPRDIARLLRRYRIKPRDVRIGDKSLKGYYREQFDTAWQRHGGDLSATSATSQDSRGFSGVQDPRQNPECRGSKQGENARPIRDVAHVADKSAPNSTQHVCEADNNGALGAPRCVCEQPDLTKDDVCLRCGGFWRPRPSTRGGDAPEVASRIVTEAEIEAEIEALRRRFVEGSE
jgi:hypothetical protein